MVCVGFGSTLSVGVGLAAAASAAMVVQAASQVAEAAVDIVADWGEALAELAAEQADAQLISRRWHMAAADAVGVNGMIRIMEVRAAQLGHTVDLPAPLVLDGRSLAEVGAWLTRTRPLLQRARQGLDQAGTAAEWQRLSSELGTSSWGGPSVGEVLGRYQESLAQRHSGAVRAPADLSWVEAEVHAVLNRLAGDADARDREAVLRAAARVARQTDESDADAYLMALRRVVDNDVNPRSTARQLAATWLQAMEQSVVERALAAAPELPWAAAAKDLGDVVTGAAELTPDLRARAAAALDWAKELTRAAYRLDLVAALLVRRGYRITARSDSDVHVTHAGWSGEHTAQVSVGVDDRVHSRLRAEIRMQGDDAALREFARRAELQQDVEEALHELSHDGVTGLVGYAHHVQRQHGAESVEQSSTTGLPLARERRTGSPSGH